MKATITKMSPGFRVELEFDPYNPAVQPIIDGFMQNGWSTYRWTTVREGGLVSYCQLAKSHLVCGVWNEYEYEVSREFAMDILRDIEVVDEACVLGVDWRSEINDLLSGVEL